MPKIVHRNAVDFHPPEFHPHRFFRSGHLQTLATVGTRKAIRLSPTSIRVAVSDGDSIMLHEDLPIGGDRDEPRGCVLLVHGLTGCHGAPYMLRLADRFTRLGMRVYRMDMRGFGAALDLTENLSHAGRSDDCIAALKAIVDRNPAGPIFAIGVSLGGGQLLRGLGRIGAGIDGSPAWIDRIAGVAAVSPPLDLIRCSDNMQRLPLRPYNHYFIRSLLSRIPPGVRRRKDFADCLAGKRPRTLRELDERFTAPLSGFSSAAEYYDASSASHVVDSIRVPTLVLTANDDPIVPVDCFSDDLRSWSETTQVIITRHGGHVGFISRDRTSWMDQTLQAWIENRTEFEPA